MLKQGKRICPCCGKPLELMGKVLGNKYHEFYLGERVTTASLYKETFERDKIWDSAVKMYCSECGVRIKLLHDPFPTFGVVSFFIVLAVFVSSVIAVLTGTNIIPKVLPAAAAVETVLLICAAVRRGNITKYESNFTFVDEAIPIFDGEFDFEPNVRAVMELAKKQRKYIRTGNIFETEISSSRVYLYLISSRCSGKVCELELRLCGTADDAEKYCRSLKKAENPVTLPLTFEGKPVGTAAVTEIYENKDRGL